MSMADTREERTKGESGMALIIAIGFLALLSILGALVMRVTTEDLKSAAGLIPNQQAFNVADRAVEYALNRDIIVGLSTGDTVNLLNDDAITPGTLTHKAIIGASTLAQLESGSVVNIGPQDLPATLKDRFGSDFGANAYHVQIKAKGTGSGGAASGSNVNASIVRLFKMDDDSIYITDGGG
jgi:hypothetical protein